MDLEKQRRKKALYVKNFIFGVEDSLVSTVGLLSGIAVAGVPKSTILLTGIILIFVEGFSMGIGSLLSEHTAEKFLKGKEVPFSRSFSGGLIMFFSYIASGFIPLAPYVFIVSGTALVVSIILSLITLFTLGAVSARMFGVPIARSALEMMIIGGIAVLVGVIFGAILNA